MAILDLMELERVQLLKYLVEFLHQILEYAKCHTNQETELKFGVAANVFRKWNEELKVYEPKKPSCRPKRRKFSIQEKRKILEHAKEHGISKAAKEYGVATKMIMAWNTVYQVYTVRPMRTFTDEFKQKAATYAKEHSVSTAAYKFGVTITSIRDWLSKTK